MEANGSVYEKNVLRENAVFRKKNGALERTRTFTPFGHNHLKVACLPIPPRAHRGPGNMAETPPAWQGVSASVLLSRHEGTPESGDTGGERLSAPVVIQPLKNTWHPSWPVWRLSHFELLKPDNGDRICIVIVSSAEYRVSIIWHGNYLGRFSIESKKVLRLYW